MASSSLARVPGLLLVALVPILLPACSGGGGSGGGGAPPPEDGNKPDGSGRYFSDPHERGEASRLFVEEVFWGRLVDVHDIDAASGAVDPIPVFRDWVINENVQSDGTRYELETNPITQATRLVIQREDGAPAQGGDTFDSLLVRASSNLPPIVPKHDDGSSVGPFSIVARNACLVVRFSDLLDDADPSTLAEEVRIVTGYRPSVPFEARVLFDANHGGIGFDGAFHSTRVLIDATVSEVELPTTEAPINPLGLPSSLTTETDPNLSLRLPTRVDFASGQFTVLTNLQGGELDTSANGPVDEGAPTQDLVRAMRAGNGQDLNNGFLADLNLPEVIGSWPADVLAVQDDPAGVAGFDFRVELQFQTGCAAAPRVGDVVRVGARFLEVTAPAGSPQGGLVRDVPVRALGGAASPPSAFVGGALYLSSYDPFGLVEPACWLRFSQTPGVFPAGDVDPNASVSVRFSEPMDPASIRPFDTLRLVRGPAGSAPSARSLVVAEVEPGASLDEFASEPVLPLAHAGSGDTYHVELIGGPDGVTDLAGNALTAVPPFVEFTIDPNAPQGTAAGIVLRFEAANELDVERGFNDLRGQLFYDFEEGVVRPRPVQARSVVADRSRPVPSIMIPFPLGVQTPLTPLGSKLQTVWRYADLGWVCDDEANFNVDVAGLSWSPIGSSIVADFYDEFEIVLGHANRLPDEALTAFLLPIWPQSGLRGPPAEFTDNVLVDQRDPSSSQVVVHPRTIGYVVDPTTLFVSETGTALVPFPWNRTGAAQTTYTWRDTAITTVGGDNGAGIPMNVETLPPLLLDPRPSGAVAPAGQVPSFGLPLLMEFRCFPNDTGIGLNPVDISLAINSAAQPNFRAYSTGGFDASSQPIRVDPDLALVPAGGFNPRMNGAPTPPVDNSFYVGQLDLVTRISRAHTVFLDTLLEEPSYRALVTEPSASELPLGTGVSLAIRGATGFGPETGDAVFDGARIDPYGDPREDLDGDPTGHPERLTVDYLDGDPTWKDDVRAADGARFVQLRVTFVNDLAGGTSPWVSSLALAFEDRAP